MASPTKKGDEKSLPPKQSTVLLLLTIADTTWRLFIPTIGFTIAGLLLDKQFGTTPWVMVVSMALGVAIALLLTRSQLKKVKNV
jgi:hypothetical protein